jgi:hypothetical protein
MYGCAARGWTLNDFHERAERKIQARLRQAGLTDDRQLHINATSFDSVSRDPLRVPFAAYPLHPVACARIIGDLTVFTVETSGPALADSMRRAGIDARWVRERSRDELKPREVVMEMATRSPFRVPGEVGRWIREAGKEAEHVRGLQMQRSEIDMYLIQLLNQETWIGGIRYMLNDAGLKARPWPHYRCEDEVWV